MPMTKIRLKYVDEYVDRNGKLRRYFRKGGKRLGQLPGLPGSAEFMAAYQGFLDAKTVIVVRQKPEGSFAKLVNVEVVRRPAIAVDGRHRAHAAE